MRRDSDRRILDIVLLGAAMSAVVFLRLPSFGPLFFDPDVAAAVYSAELFSEGSCIYPDAVETKPPGSYAMIALLFALGRTATGFHVAVAVYHALCALAVFALARRLFGAGAGGFAALFYAAYSACGFVNGLAPNFETWTLLPVVLSAAAAVEAVKRGSWKAAVLAGMLAGTATLMKQQTVLIGCALGLVLALPVPGQATRSRDRVGAVALFAIGALLPWIAMSGYFAAKGCLPDLFAALSPGRAAGYAASNDPVEFAGRAWRFTSYFVRHTWLLCAAGAAGLFLPRRIAGRRVVWAWGVGAAAAIVAGTKFFPHYYFFAVPVLAVAGGGFVGWIATRPKRAAARVAIAVLVVGLCGVNLRREGALAALSAESVASGGEAVSLEMLNHNVSYGPPWLDYAAGITCAEVSMLGRIVGHYIGANSEPTDGLLVYDYVPTVYLAADRRAPTRHHMNFEVAAELPAQYGRWIDERTDRLQRNRDELMADLAADPPLYIVRFAETAWDEDDMARHALNPLTGRPLATMIWQTPLFPALGAFVDAHYRVDPDAPDVPLEVLRRDDRTFGASARGGSAADH